MRKYVKESLNEGNPYDRPVMGGKIFDPNEASGGGPIAPDEFQAVAEAVRNYLRKLILEENMNPDDALEILGENIADIASEIEEEYEQRGEPAEHELEEGDEYLEDEDDINHTDTEKLDKKYPYPR